MALGQFDDVETSVIRSLSSASLYMFTRRMFYQRRGYVWQRANHHAPICNALERVFNGETKRLIINIPPRYSKTEIAVVNFIAWAMGRVPDCEFIHASYSAALAVNNSV
ncbi:terminase, partial [Neisseria gonorrhoeae]